MAAVNARAEEYKESGAFGDTPMDVLRAHAYLDLITGRPAAERIASPNGKTTPPSRVARAQAGAAARAAAEARTGNEPAPSTRRAARRHDPDGSACAGCDGSCLGRRRLPAAPNATAALTTTTSTTTTTAATPTTTPTAVPTMTAAPAAARSGGPGPGGPGPAARPRQGRPGSGARRPHRAAGYAARAGRAARRDPRLRPPRPGAGPATGRRRDRQPAHQGLRDRHQPRRIRHRPRLRPPRPHTTPGRPARPRPPAPRCPPGST